MDTFEFNFSQGPTTPIQPHDIIHPGGFMVHPSFNITVIGGLYTVEERLDNLVDWELIDVTCDKSFNVFQTWSIAEKYQ